MSQKGWRVKKLFLSCQNSESTIFFFSSFPFFLINHNFNDMSLFIRNSSDIIFCDSNIYILDLFNNDIDCEFKNIFLYVYLYI